MEEEILKVRMLGGFSMVYQERQPEQYDFPVEKAAGGGRSARSQVFLPEKRNLLLGFRDPCGDRPLCF